MAAPDYWYAWSTAFFVVGVITFLVIAGVVVVLAMQVIQLKRKVEELTNHVQSLTEKVEKTVAEIGQRSISALAGTQNTLGIIEKFAGSAASTVGLLEAASLGLHLFKLIKGFKKKKARKAPVKALEAGYTES